MTSRARPRADRGTFAYTPASMPAVTEIDRAARRLVGWRAALAPTVADHPALVRALPRVVAHARRYHASVLDARFVGAELHVAVSARDADVVAPLVLGATRAREGVTVRWHARDGLARLAIGREIKDPAGLLRAVIGDLAGRIEEACADVDPEGVHQLRVMIRRARTVRRAIGAAGDVALAPLDAAIAAIAEPAAIVRDGDVARATLVALGLSAQATARHDAWLAGRRADGVAALRRACGERAVRDALVAAQRPGFAYPALDASEVFRARYARDLRGLRRALAKVDDLVALHDVRRRARRLRDLLDLTGRALGKGRRALRGTLQPVVHPLGHVNDLATLRAALEEEGPLDHAVSAPLGVAMHAAMSSALGPLLALSREVEALRGYAAR